MKHVATFQVRETGSEIPGFNLERTVLKLTQAGPHPQAGPHQLRIFKDRLEIYKLPLDNPGEYNHFDYSHEVFLVNLSGPRFYSPDLTRMLSEYLEQVVPFEVILEKLAILLSSLGQVESPHPFDQVYAELIKGSIITGAPRIELDDLPEFPSVKQEEPIIYTRSEVIEIIKMIRPDIADVQTVINRLLFKP